MGTRSAQWMSKLHSVFLIFSARKVYQVPRRFGVVLYAGKIP
jgi:hypothetical protein